MPTTPIEPRAEVSDTTISSAAEAIQYAPDAASPEAYATTGFFASRGKDHVGQFEHTIHFPAWGVDIKDDALDLRVFQRRREITGNPVRNWMRR